MALKTLPKEPRPPRRLSGGSTGGAGSYGLSAGRAYANTAVYWEAIPVFGALRAQIRALVATANATLDFILMGPDFDPEQLSVKATATITDAGTEDDLKFTAKVGGLRGQEISVALVDPSANDAALAVTVTGKAISVSLATGSGGAITSTAAEVKAAIEAHTDANNLVTVTLPDDTGETGAGVVSAASQTYLVLAFTAIVGTQYAATAIAQLALTAGTQGAKTIDLYGEQYLLLKLTGSGSGTVNYIDVSQHCDAR